MQLNDNRAAEYQAFGEPITKAASAVRGASGGGVPVGVAAGIAGGCEPAARYRLREAEG